MGCRLCFPCENSVHIANNLWESGSWPVWPVHPPREGVNWVIIMSAPEAPEKGLPSSIDAERFVLGSILLDDALYIQAAGTLEPDDFMLEKHRRVFTRMGELQERGERIDRITVANELMKFNELEACGGLSYLVSLDDGLPQMPNIDSYIRIVKEKAVLRRIIFASQHMMSRCLMGEEEPDDILAGAEETLLKLGEARVKTGLVHAGQILESYEGGINAFLDPSKRIKGISTGFAKFDEFTGGLHGGDLVIIAARPSMGKTALALNIAQHAVLKVKKTVAVFSLEMSRESLLTRMVCAAARVDSQRFRAGYLTQDERRKLNRSLTELAEAPLFIDDTAGLHLMDMHAKLRRLKSERGQVDLVIVDYLQLMNGRGRFENRNQEVSALSRGMKLLAKEMNVPMMVLSQLNRAVETRQGDHRPQLSDLRESGSIEQDADVVGFIFREEVYHKDREDLRGLAELIIAKQRNGPVGTVNLVFLHAQTKFENRAEDTGELPEE
jgi:replicative DNA helicase